jgi:hypothetical protein
MKPEFEVRFLSRQSGDGVGHAAGRLNHAVWRHNSMSMCNRRIGHRFKIEIVGSKAGSSEITCPVCLEKLKS